MFAFIDIMYLSIDIDNIASAPNLPPPFVFK